MKILNVIASMNPNTGGPCQGIRNVMPAMYPLGCDNEVCCLDEKSTDFGVHDPFPIHLLGPRMGPWAYAPRLMPWLSQNLSRFDVVIIHGLWQFHSYAITKVIAKLKRGSNNKIPRVYVMPHGMLDPWFQRDSSRRMKAIRNWFVWKLIENRAVFNADGLLFTCQKELELAREPFRPYRPKQELNVGYGVPAAPLFTDAMANAFRNACPEIANQKYLLFLSRIHPKKGIDLLLQAYAKVANDIQASSPAPALVIAGPLDSPYAAAMQKLAMELGLWSDGSSPNQNGPPRVFFPGMLQGDAKWGAFYGCEAFVLPSHQENFGIAVVEALACGKPVLISDQVNICHEIEEDRAGIVAPDTLDGAVQLLLDFMNLDRDAVCAMNRNAVQCFTKRFDMDTVARNFLAAMKSNTV